jgi:hypothetical protein
MENILPYNKSTNNKTGALGAVYFGFPKYQILHVENYINLTRIIFKDLLRTSQ